MRSETLLGSSDAIEDAGRRTMLVPSWLGRWRESRSRIAAREYDPSLRTYCLNHFDFATVRMERATRGGNIAARRYLHLVAEGGLILNSRCTGNRFVNMHRFSRKASSRRLVRLNALFTRSLSLHVGEIAAV